MKSIKMFLAVLISIVACFCLAWYQENKAQAASMQNVIRINTSKTVEAASSTYSPNTATSILLDAGHGGYDSGSVALDGTLEKDVTLALTLAIGEQLEEAGIVVYYTRESDEVSWESDNIADLHTRVAMGVDSDVDYYISIHTNFSSYNDGAYGFETYWDGNDTLIETMAESIHAQLSSLQYSQDRGLKTTAESPLYVIDYNPISSLLLEVGFLSDRDDANYMIQHTEELADAIAKGILASL